MLRKFVFAGAMLAVAAAWSVYARARRWQATWGIDPLEQEATLPGDDLVPDATAVETRGVDVAAPREAVWPWLVQMGYGRGGWYSIDQLDMAGRSAETIVPELQGLAVGDVMPTHPGGGFEVRALEPGRSLVLFTDTALVQAQSEAAAARREAGETDAVVPPGLAASGAVLSATPPSFAASWTFALEPLPDGGTRLIERFRARFDDVSPASALVLPWIGFGVVVMMHRQMIGIRRRAERLARRRDAAVEPTLEGTPA
jgi:hypothetical protein